MPKGKNSKRVNQFRTWKGKYSIFRRQAYQGSPDAWNTRVLQARSLRRSREKRKRAVWLDLGKAFGSVPRKLIESEIELNHIPENVQEIVKSYFGLFRI